MPVPSSPLGSTAACCCCLHCQCRNVFPTQMHCSTKMPYWLEPRPLPFPPRALLRSFFSASCCQIQALIVKNIQTSFVADVWAQKEKMKRLGVAGRTQKKNAKQTAEKTKTKQREEHHKPRANSFFEDVKLCGAWSLFVGITTE